MLTPPPQQDTHVSIGLLVSLSAFTWIGLDPANAPVGMVLVTPSPARGAEDADRTIEQRMRSYAAALGMSEPEEPMADLGSCLTLHPRSAHVLLHTNGARYGLQLPAHPRWVRLLLRRSDVAVIVGLDPLARIAAMADVDSYLALGLEGRRLLFGTAHAVRTGAAHTSTSPPAGSEIPETVPTTF
ncbi:hypothetical protein [Actinacidiphila oryziradicis]|uniref:Uncharacterized protein n=1 Tax=Actinacidiphila oryziradicis TaxID=2571141 RepID=A0A4U0SSR4_9ACTN|nr:hypothetical protein [Actinacidiphila oryziradicis]TKA13092.1 hypothetical protein FCI23_03670 [Actinacidiphila oryziradicis]